ncbi:MAG TPA: YbaB/EbfC family nucleoid-associated protein [Candidatus Stackebrandtia faecavium]|nr:YbaB/EbfC family nucleoid-associated protein [Candidatus Stackebrandtia faecavium]
MSVEDFYEQFKAHNYAFKKGYEERLHSLKQPEPIDDTLTPSSDGSVIVRMDGDCRITGLRINPEMWEARALTEEDLAKSVTNAYNHARTDVYRRHRREALRKFGL